jgi:ABC-type transport system involved in multi-copper enzyme maturation permease subunit
MTYNLPKKTIIAIAKNTFKESIRDKVLYAIVAFAILFVAFTAFLGSISLGENLHVVRSLGLAGMYVAGLFLSIFLGASLMYKELERRTLYFVLSKPVTRAQLVAGKFLGLFVSVIACIMGMTLVYLCVVGYEGGGFDGTAVAAILFQLFEIAIIIALSTFFSTFSRPLAATLYTIIAVYIGHSFSLLINTATRLHSPALIAVSKGFSYILPNLEKFNIRNTVIYGTMPSAANTLLVVAYTLLYVAILLYAGRLMLEKREL